MSQSGARLCLEVTVITLLLITCLLSPWEASAEGGEQGGEFSPTLLRTKGVTLCRRAAVTWALGLRHTVCNLWWEWSQSLYLYWEKKYIVAPENSFLSVNILAQAIFDVDMKCPKCKWFQCWGLFFLSFLLKASTDTFIFGWFWQTLHSEAGVSRYLRCSRWSWCQKVQYWHCVDNKQYDNIVWIIQQSRPTLCITSLRVHLFVFSQVVERICFFCSIFFLKLRFQTLSTSIRSYFDCYLFARKETKPTIT